MKSATQQAMIVVILLAAKSVFSQGRKDKLAAAFFAAYIARYVIS
jgi:hypothetical protein